MTEISRIGLDTSKSVFTLHAVDAADRPVLRVNLRRAQLIPFFRKRAPTLVAMEACGGSHHWARKLTALGHEVRIRPRSSGYRVEFDLEHPREGVELAERLLRRAAA